ncbi:hypothetical protein JCM11641_008290 [Rhodosporidiobolus odoratus]
MNRPRRSAQPVERYGSAYPSILASPRVVTTRSTVRQASGAVTAGEGETEALLDSVDSAKPQQDPQDDLETPRSKRQRDQSPPASMLASTAVRKGRKGKLSAFAELPVDIVLDIASHLDPSTLVSFARTNQALRSALLRRAADGIRRAAYDKAQLPELQAGSTSHRQMVLFVGNKKCMVCHKSSGAIIDFRLKVRFCKPCQLDSVLPVSKVFETVLVGGEFVEDWVMPATHVFVPAVADVPHLLEDLSKNGALKLAREEHVARVEAVEAPPLIDRRPYYTRPYLLHDSAALRQWAVADQHRRSLEADAAMASREEAIMQKIEELGYERSEHAFTQTLLFSAALTFSLSRYFQSLSLLAFWTRSCLGEKDCQAHSAAAGTLRDSLEPHRSRLGHLRSLRLEHERAELAAQAERERVEAKRIEEARMRRAEEVTPADLRSFVEAATSLSHDQQASFFSPFVFQLGCRLCVDRQQGHHFFTYSDFRLHKAEVHGLVDPPRRFDPGYGFTLDTWVDESWTSILEQALKLVGLTAQAGVSEALEKLGTYRWKCAAPYTWEKMVEHILTNYRGATLRLPSSISLALTLAPPSPIPPKPEGGPSQVSPPTADSQKDSTTNAGSSSKAQTLRDGA